MDCQLRFRSIAPVLAALLYLLGTAADPLLHAYEAADAHVHAEAALCAADDPPAEGHDPASCTICRLSAAPALPGDGSAAPRPADLGRATPGAEAPRAPSLRFLSPAPRGPPHA